MKMNWAYQEFVSGGADGLIEPMRNFLNGLPAHVGTTAKITMSDQHDGKARAVIFYDTIGKVTTPPSFPLADFWEVAQFKCRSDYKRIYQQTVAKLNAASSTPDNTVSRAVYSSASFSNAHDNEAIIGLAYYDGEK